MRGKGNATKMSTGTDECVAHKARIYCCGEYIKSPKRVADPFVEDAKTHWTRCPVFGVLCCVPTVSEVRWIDAESNLNRNAKPGRSSRKQARLRRTARIGQNGSRRQSKTKPKNTRRHEKWRKSASFCVFVFSVLCFFPFLRSSFGWD